MSTEPEVTRVVRSWLTEGADRMPDRVLDAVLERLPTTPQRRPSWLTRRSSTMSTPARLGVAAAAIAVVAVAGYALLPRNASVGVPGPSASPTASPMQLAPGSTNVILDAGAYRIADPFLSPFAISLKDGWILSTLDIADVQFHKALPEQGAVWLVVDRADSVFSDPCHTEGGPIASPAPSTVDALVAALSTMIGFSAGPVTDVSIDGHAGKRLTLTNSVNTDTAACSGGAMLSMWTFKTPSGTGASGTNGGATEDLTVLDVDGTPVIIDVESFSTTPAADLTEAQGVVDALTFD